MKTLYIQQSLIHSVLKHKTGLRLELLKPGPAYVPDAKSDNDDLLVIPAHPGALNSGNIVGENPDVSPLETFTIRVLNESTVKLEGSALEGYTPKVIDTDQGKKQRLSEVTRSTGYNPDDMVYVIGTGSVGSNAAMMLFRSGWRNVVLVDPDRVEGHNSTKSAVYSDPDIGYPKVDVLAAYLRRINPSGCVYAFSEPFDQDFLLNHSEFIEANLPKVVFASADSQNVVQDLVRWGDSFRGSDLESPHFVISLCFQNALAAVTIHWDPLSDEPCPNCLFMSNDIYDAAHSPVEIDKSNYSPYGVSSSPQLGIDIFYHNSLAMSVVLAILTENPERLNLVAATPWLYSIAYRTPPEEVDWIDPETVGHVYPFPGRPQEPVAGCPCCREAGRVKDAVPVFLAL